MSRGFVGLSVGAGGDCARRDVPGNGREEREWHTWERSRVHTVSARLVGVTDGIDAANEIRRTATVTSQGELCMDTVSRRDFSQQEQCCSPHDRTRELSARMIGSKSA